MTGTVKMIIEGTNVANAVYSSKGSRNEYIARWYETFDTIGKEVFVQIAPTTYPRQKKVAVEVPGKKPIGRGVMDVVTGETFSTLKEVCEKKGVQMHTLANNLYQNRTNKTNFRFIERKFEKKFS